MHTTSNLNHLSHVIFAISFVFNILRKSLSYIILSVLQSKQQRNKLEIGVLNTYYSFGYGISKIISGILSDVFSPSLILIFGLLMSAVLCGIIPYLNHYYSFLITFFLNGIFHGVAGTIHKILTTNFPNDKVGLLWALVVSLGNIGYMLAPFIFIFLDEMFLGEIKFVFLLISFVSLILCVISHSAFRNLNNDHINKLNNNDKEHNTNESIIEVFRDINVWTLFLANLLTIFIIKGLSDWTGLYFIEYANLNKIQSAEYVLWNEFGGLIGTIAAGYTCEYLHGNSSITSLIFTSISIPFFLIIPNIESIFNSFQLVSLYEMTIKFCLFMSGFGINGPKTLLLMVLQQSCSSNISGSINGIAGLFGQLGASIAGYGIGFVVHHYGWFYFFKLISFSHVLLVLLLIPPSVKYYKDNKNKKNI